MRKVRFLFIVLSFVMLGAGSTRAGSLTVPNTFSKDTPAIAASVNDNFTAVETEVTDNAGNIAASAASISQNRTDIATNAGNITSHTHAASAIVSGTLSDARFSAYSDLGIEGRLNNNSGTDILTRIQSDGRYSSSGHTHTGISTNALNISDNAAFISSLQNAHAATRTGYYDVNPASCVKTVTGTSTGSIITPGYLSTSLPWPGENFTCQINIPHGAVVREMVVDWSDTDASYDGELTLVEVLKGSVTPSPMVTVFSTGSAGFSAYSKTSITSPTMDLVTKTYGIILTLLSPQTEFRRALIRYEYFLD